MAREIDVLLSGVPQRVTPEELARGLAVPDPPETPTRLWVAPANYAGQGHLWARAVEAHLKGVGARSMAVEGPHGFPADQVVPVSAYRDVAWQRAQERYLTRHYTHVLAEAGKPVLGTLHGRTIGPELPALTRHGLRVALIAHGSDLRLPSRHADRFPHSPFRDAADPQTARLERNARVAAELFATVDAPTFVSTPDLLDDAPGAIWCPTVVEPQRWASDAPVLERERPVVVHIPSRGPLKGSQHLDPALTRLQERGRVRYVRLEGVSHEVVRETVRSADVVVDQAVMGLYGVSALEGLAAGRLVLGFVGDRVRERVRRHTGLEVPIVEIDPDTVADVLDDVLSHPDRAREQAAAGPGFVREVHDGRLSARVLQDFLQPVDKVQGAPSAPGGADR